MCHLLVNTKCQRVNPLSANPIKWSITRKTNCLSMFDNFVGLALEGVMKTLTKSFGKNSQRIP